MKKVITISIKDIVKIYKPVVPSTHKGQQGHALIVGGSYGKIGAIALSSKACLKAGAGLVSVFIPKCGYTILQTINPEVMAVTDVKNDYLSEIQFDLLPQAIGIGPGMGQERSTKKGFYKFLKANKAPLVLDADALNILSQHKEWFSLLQPGSILTPHPKELERLTGNTGTEDEKREAAMEMALKHKIIIVLKGAPTYITDGEDIYKNTTGNAALATAGSGDVLTGIITSLLAQSYSPLQAAILGVYIHGLTADIALPETGHQAFIASDIITYLGKAYLAIEQQKDQVSNSM